MARGWEEISQDSKKGGKTAKEKTPIGIGIIGRLKLKPIRRLLENQYGETI